MIAIGHVVSCDIIRSDHLLNSTPPYPWYGGTVVQSTRTCYACISKSDRTLQYPDDEITCAQP